ncbi:MAG TPA: Ig domain-containing protein, partial [Paracoccaceae bacterium]|nr:Ig domain-containing protein [Paracoccaceae bacterium]
MLGIGLEVMIMPSPLILGVKPQPPVSIASPAIAGTAQVGTLVSGSAGTWKAGSRATIQWAWQRDGTDIPGAIGTGAAVAAYSVTSADYPSQIRLRVTVTNPAGNATRATPAIAVGYATPTVSGGAWDLLLPLNEPMRPYDAAVAFVGADLTYALAPGSAALPAGLALSSTGVLSGTPGAAVAGTALILQASNPGGAATKAVSLTVEAPHFYADYATGQYSADGTAASSFGAIHSFSRASTASRLTSAGIIEIVVENGPRYDHAPSGTPLGLLVEPAATNWLLQSEELVTGWSQSSITRSSAGLFVRGRWVGVSLASTGGLSNRIHRTVNVTEGQPLQVRAFFRYGSSGRFRVQLRNASANTDSAIRGSQGSLAVNSQGAGAISGLAEVTESDNVSIVDLTFTPNFTGS